LEIYAGKYIYLRMDSRHDINGTDSFGGGKMSKENVINMLKTWQKEYPKMVSLDYATRAKMIKELEEETPPGYINAVYSRMDAIYKRLEKLEEPNICRACGGSGIQHETSVGGDPRKCSICDGSGSKPKLATRIDKAWASDLQERVEHIEKWIDAHE
jgi:rubrerythrin